MRSIKSTNGQALTEALLVSWLLLIFIAGMWQLFVVNDTIFRSLAAVDTIIFKKAYARNKSTTDYDRDRPGHSSVVVVWGRPELPEAEFPVVNMFKNAVGVSSFKIVSNVEADG